MTTKYLLPALLLLLSLLAVAQQPEKIRKTRRGMIAVGPDSLVRVFQPFGGSEEAGQRYAHLVNAFADSLDGEVRLFCMIAPEAAAYYTPDTFSLWSRPVEPAITNIYNTLSDKVTPIDAFTALAPHVDEPIFLRTDHHWAPLGAYYAAEVFAQKAEVPFRDLTQFDTDTIHNFIGTMNRYSGDLACRNAPEDFVYYRPKDTETRATYVKYRLDRRRHVIGQSEPVEEDFFYRYNEGSSAAYCTFMGGDTRTVVVNGHATNQRRLLITKDSFGNALPAYLFHSFEEIHVIDPRYFSKSILRYARQNGITDWLITNCVTFAHTTTTCDNLRKLMK